MEYVNLGNTGLKVSRLCVGCMGFGAMDRGGIPGKTGESEAREIIKYALEQGISFFDTANIYSMGASEEILGRAIKDFGNRDDVVLATKLYFGMYEGANAKGLNRKAIFREVDKSLERLQTDYIDLYIIHRLDHTTPIEEVMEALNDLVRMGKIRYIGASSMYAWQFIKANMIAKQRGWAQFVSMQDTYSLVYREEEKEMIPMCIDQKIALTPFSPLAHGVLAKSHVELRDDKIGNIQNDYMLEHDREIIKRIEELAIKKGISQSQLALAWVLNKPYITAPLIGSTKAQYLEEAIKALEITLTDEEMNYLEEPYVPHNQYGFR